MGKPDKAFLLQDAMLKRNNELLIDEFSWEIYSGESWWICGANGTGKTSLLEVLAGQQRLASGEIIPSGNFTIEKFFSSVALIRRDFTLYHLFNRSASFYQQRFFSSGAEETPTVLDFIVAETGITEEKILATAIEFRFDQLLNKRIISLSTGEGRRILLLILWLTDKKIICIDDPYAGLDHDGKQIVNHALTTLKRNNVTILITGVEPIPPHFFDNILFIKDKRIIYSGPVNDFPQDTIVSDKHSDKLKISRRLHEKFDCTYKVVAAMENITVSYSDKPVQKDFSWTIKKGDKWMLTGPNGSGKSTLMSLIYGDNPMAYAYKLTIFDHVRGTGESIWDIKRQMGYFSSELQQFFPLSMTLYEAVLSGYSDHFAVRKDLTPEHYQQANEIIDAAGLTEFRNSYLIRLSFSKCRLALVCRALVKLPPVVILDEPCQGLDKNSTGTVNRLVDIVCKGEHNTLIYVTHNTDYIPTIINKKLNLEQA